MLVTLCLRANVRVKIPNHEKLAANWEGQYRVKAKTDNGAYYLETLSDLEITNTWNATKLKMYYS